METTSTATAPLTADDEARIRELVRLSQEGQGDPATLPGLHTENLVLVNIAGRRVYGRESFSAAMAEALASPLKDVRTELEVHDVRPLTPDTADAAIVSLTKTVHDERDGAEASALPQAGSMSYVVVREGGDWRIALAQTTPMTPVP